MNKNTKIKIPDLDTLSLEVYNDSEFAKSYASKIEYNSHNALYERPATLSLLPDVRGKKILDAGCGPGIYTELLTDKGAMVTAIDHSPEMIALTREKAGEKANIILANMNSTLDFLKNEEFDIIISSMVIHYIKDWHLLFSEFNRVLKKDGLLIFSTGHPFAEYADHSDGNYFDTEMIVELWPSYNINVTSYRRPLGDIFKVLKETDFRIDEVLEPQPVEECRERFPDAFEILSTKPWFICFKAIKVN